MLYKITNNESYLNFAKRIYENWAENMVIHQTGQVLDSLDIHGVKAAVPMTYNQGLSVGVALALYKVTGANRYLNDANLYSGYVLNHMTHNGVLIEPVCSNHVSDCRKNRDLVQFKGITYLYLVKLSLETPKNKMLFQMLDRTARSLWNVARDSKTGLYAHEWDGSDNQAFNTFSSSTSAALALGAYAKLLRQVCEVF